MISPYIVLGGIEIPYTVDQYQRKGRKYIGVFENLYGGKNLYFLTNEKGDIVTKYSFSLDTSIDFPPFEILKVFSVEGSVSLIDFSPIVEWKNAQSKNILYLDRLPYPLDTNVKVYVDGYGEYNAIFQNTPPGAGEVSIYTDGTKKIQFPSSITGNVYVQYTPIFYVYLTDDPFYKSIKNDIWHIRLDMEEV